MIANILNILSMLLIFGIVPVALMVYKKKIKFLNGVFLGTFLLLISFACSVYVTQTLYGYNPIDYTINTVADSLVSAYEGAEGVTDAQISQMKQVTNVLRDMYFVLMPTVVVISYLLWAYLSLMLAKGIFALFRKDVSGFGKFCDLKMPSTATLLAIASYVLSMLFEDSRISYGFINFSLIIFIMTSFCGLSMIDFWLRKKIRLSIVRLVIYIVGFFALSMLMGIGASIILFVGIADASFDFRNGPKRIKKDGQ